MNPIWKVYIEDINQKEIVEYNVFDHSAFKKDVIDLFNTCWNDYEDYSFTSFKTVFKQKLDKEVCLYYFWSKTEWEIILSDWPPSPPEFNFKSKKISVYDQLKLNWDAFVDYIISWCINS